jgi:hypothetical protein
MPGYITVKSSPGGRPRRARTSGEGFAQCRQTGPRRGQCYDVECRQISRSKLWSP